jgi:hypothetical protein
VDDKYDKIVELLEPYRSLRQQIDLINLCEQHGIQFISAVEIDSLLARLVLNGEIEPENIMKQQPRHIGDPYPGVKIVVKPDG